MNATVLERLTNAKIIPVVEIADANQAVELALVLTEAGLPVMEVTLRTPSALDAIHAISTEFPDFLVGAGTLLTAAQLDDSVASGAKFGVSPGFTREMSDAAAAARLTFIPGAVTASEILNAAERGHTHLKFFPAEQSGGAPVIGAFAAPFAGGDIKFMPTGGIRPSNLSSYLALPNVFAIGGTWIVPREAISNGDFEGIRTAARNAVDSVANLTMPA